MRFFMRILGGAFSPVVSPHKLTAFLKSPRASRNGWETKVPLFRAARIEVHGMSLYEPL